MLKDIEQYLRMDRLPHIWCPGCGNGIIMKAILEAFHKLDWDQDKTVIVSGIGCSSRASGYMNFDTVHTAHGRALAFATGIKLAKPELNVFIITGDGDGAAIGGNHLIHAARRNIDLNVIMFNNHIYGMTGGQYSPLTPTGKVASTSPYGNLERSFDICELVKSAGATYVARSTAYHVKQLVQVIIGAAQNKGFSFVEALAMCPVSYGKYNNYKDAPHMIKWMKDSTLPTKAAAKLPSEKVQGKIITGVLYQDDAPEYTELYADMVARVQNGGIMNG